MNPKQRGLALLCWVGVFLFAVVLVYCTQPYKLQYSAPLRRGGTKRHADSVPRADFVGAPFRGAIKYTNLADMRVYSAPLPSPGVEQ